MKDLISKPHFFYSLAKYWIEFVLQFIKTCPIIMWIGKQHMLLGKITHWCFFFKLHAVIRLSKEEAAAPSQGHSQGQLKREEKDKREERETNTFSYFSQPVRTPVMHFSCLQIEFDLPNSQQCQFFQHKYALTPHCELDALATSKAPEMFSYWMESMTEVKPIYISLS